MSWVTEFPGLKSLGGCLSIVAVALSLTACGGSAPGASSTDTSSAASRIDIALDKTAISNTGVETVAVTITAVNQSGNAVSGAPISVSVDGGGIYAGAASTTDANGQVTGTVGSGSDRSNRMITITAKSGSASASTAVRVTGAQLAVTGTSNVSASAATTITFKLTDSTGAAIAGQTVSVSATGFSPASATGTTNTSGEYLFNVTAPSALGTYTVSGAAAGATASYSVQVGSGAVPAQAATIKSVSIQANPATIKPNLSGSDSLASIRVLVQGDNNAPLQNVRIIFDLPDPNGVGGTLSSGSNVVYTDATGVAQTNYIAGVRTSPTDGVLVRACYSGSDFTAPTCPASVTGTLTVSQQALSVVVGSNGLISSGTDNLTYIKKYVVVVSDAAGNAVSNAQISASVFPTYYYKGTWNVVGDAWASSNALGNRTDLINARKNLESNDITVKYFSNQSLPALDLNASYGSQGLGGTAIVRTGPLGNQTVSQIIPGATLTNPQQYSVGGVNDSAQYTFSLHGAPQSEPIVDGMSQVIGPDFTTANPQVPGISAMVFEPPLIRGQRLGKRARQAGRRRVVRHLAGEHLEERDAE